MTVPATPPLTNLVGDGSNVTFPFTWRCDASQSVSVWLNDAFQPTFTLTLNPDQSSSPGGSVTMPTAPGAGVIVSIERDTTEQQNTVFTAYGPFAAESVEDALDGIVMMLQEQLAAVNRAVKVTRANEATTSTDLPAPVAGAVLGWVAAGGGFALGSVSPSAITQTGTPGVLRKNRSLTGTQDGTNRVFTLLFVPLDGTSFDLILGGLRVPQTDYGSVGAVVTYVTGKQPQPNQSHVADIYSAT